MSAERRVFAPVRHGRQSHQVIALAGDGQFRALAIGPGVRLSRVIVTWLSRPLVVPLPNGVWLPDGFSAYPAVGLGHLTVGYVGADGGRRDVQEGGDIACCPPIDR